LEEFSDLGSGFKIAMQDLDIRGAGNLLGAEQSGFIADIGFETYHKILNEAVSELKEEDFKDIFKEKADKKQTFPEIKFVRDCQIDTDLELLFPESYISGSSERIMIYRELDSIENEEQLIKFKNELEDRFGKMPDESKQLLEIVKVRQKAIELGMEKIILKEQKMMCYFVANPQSPFYQSQLFQNIVKYLQKGKNRSRMQQKNNKLNLTFSDITNVETASFILDEMINEATMNLAS